MAITCRMRSHIIMIAFLCILLQFSLSSCSLTSSTGAQTYTTGSTIVNTTSMSSEPVISNSKKLSFRIRILQKNHFNSNSSIVNTTAPGLVGPTVDPRAVLPHRPFYMLMVGVILLGLVIYGVYWCYHRHKVRLHEYYHLYGLIDIDTRFYMYSVIWIFNINIRGLKLIAWGR